jgi:predicted metal-dependent enzyme (double-stranded beta helix superfamily)
MKNSSNCADSVVDFARQIETAIHSAEHRFLDRLEIALGNGSALLNALDDTQLIGRSDCYSRNILYSDPLERFTILALVWRNGQFTPIHGHWTWCGFSVLRGELREEHFNWNSSKQTAEFEKRIACPDDTVKASAAGLNDIHRLGNYLPMTAISLHVYGVGERQIAQRVNRVLGS